MMIKSVAKCVTCSMLGVRTAQSLVTSALHQTSLILPGTASALRKFSSFSSSAFASGQQLTSGSLARPVQNSTLNIKSGVTQHSLLTPTTHTLTQTRGRVHIYYQPSAWKRVNNHGLEGRLRSQGGVEILWRKILKGRYVLTPFDRIVPGTYGGKVLPKHHLRYNQQLINPDIAKPFNRGHAKRKWKRPHT